MFIWTISDAIGIALFILFSAIGAAVYLSIWWRQWRCKHQNGVGETSACDAICRTCGKNLGFIGAWRAANGGNK